MSKSVVESSERSKLSESSASKSYSISEVVSESSVVSKGLSVLGVGINGKRKYWGDITSCECSDWSQCYKSHPNRCVSGSQCKRSVCEFEHPPVNRMGVVSVSKKATKYSNISIPTKLMLEYLEDECTDISEVSDEGKRLMSVYHYRMRASLENGYISVMEYWLIASNKKFRSLVFGDE